MTRINDIIKDYGNVLIEVCLECDPENVNQSLLTSDKDEAEDFVLLYSNDYVYIRIPE